MGSGSTAQQEVQGNADKEKKNTGRKAIRREVAAAAADEEEGQGEGRGWRQGEREAESEGTRSC